MKPNNFQDGFQHHEKSLNPKTKIISFEKRAKKVNKELKNSATAEIITFPRRYEKVDGLKNCRFISVALFGSCGGLFGIIIFILILALLFVI